MLDCPVPEEYYYDFCIDCNHSRKRHVQLHKIRSIQQWKCWECDCRGPIFFFK